MVTFAACIWADLVKLSNVSSALAQMRHGIVAHTHHNSHDTTRVMVLAERSTEHDSTAAVLQRITL
jgi:hypothetical protein